MKKTLANKTTAEFWIKQNENVDKEKRLQIGKVICMKLSRFFFFSLRFRMETDLESGQR